MTLAGTNTYLVGAAPCWVVDPGPADERHLDAVRDAASSRGGIAGVVLTHSHADHSAGAAALGAPIQWGRAADTDETSWGAAGDAVAGAGGGVGGREGGEPARVGPFTAVPTPGHAADHACFLWEERVLFCGDLVLGQGSTIVPPRALGGSLAEYMRSLERIAALDLELMAPGHGPWIADPGAKLAEYAAHRREREARLRAALERGERSRRWLLDAVWDDVPEALRPAAALALEAHLEKLADEGVLDPDTTGP